MTFVPLKVIQQRMTAKDARIARSLRSHSPGGRMSYVDSYVIPVPKKNLKTYRRMSRIIGKVWREHGAIAYTECLADDVKPGKVTSFPQSVKLKPDETVVFSWIVYKSRAQRDRINAKVMKDPRLADMMDAKTMPFDGKRLIFGGFKLLVAA